MQSLWTGESRALTKDVTVLVGENNGKYPSGNSLIVRGSAETVVIDPSVTVVAQGGVSTRVDAVLNSHGHEDHIAGNKMFPNARVHAHRHDLLAVQRLEGMLKVQGASPQERPEMTQIFNEQFYYTPRPEAQGFSDGDVFDLGGVTVEAVHLPGHTRGHSGFRISGGIFFLSDIDLTGFGPYYGDVWSDLDQFEASLHKVRDEDADYYVTFHHKGVIEGRETFLKLLDAFAAVIPKRHAEMLKYLQKPRTINDMVRHRFIYRPNVVSVFVDRVEARSAELHLERMRQRGEIEALPDGSFIAR